MNKYTQNVLKSCVKNHVPSQFYSSYHLDLKFNILNEICYYSKGTHDKNAWKKDPFLVDLEFERLQGFRKNQR